MAFTKSIIILSGAAVPYWKLGAYRNDALAREWCGAFEGYFSKAGADGGATPAGPQVIKLRVTGDAYDTLFSRAALKVAGLTDVEQAYLVAKRASQAASPDSQIEEVSGVVLFGDFGAAIFADALDS